ncbi:hypothetical protein TNCV_4297371 [Trichonephila clavipes]|nr:hypothetical protein TNCV_4297371 [Trichonephila clavipes]
MTVVDLIPRIFLASEDIDRTPECLKAPDNPSSVDVGCATTYTAATSLYAFFMSTWNALLNYHTHLEEEYANYRKPPDGADSMTRQ